MPLSDDERKAAARERARKSRAKKRAEREAVDAAARDARDADAAASSALISTAVEDALDAMKWIKPSDGALVAQARHLASDIDTFRDAGEHSKMLSAHRALTRVLHDLGGSPTVRLQHELRSLRLTKRTEGEDGGDHSSEAKPVGNVTQFPRPARRAR